MIVRNAEYFDDGDAIILKENPFFSLKVIASPGHTPDSVVFYAEKQKAAFAGDTIFKGSIGNYQFPGSNLRDLQRSIIEKVFALME